MLSEALLSGMWKCRANRSLAGQNTRANLAVTFHRLKPNWPQRHPLDRSFHRRFGRLSSIRPTHKLSLPPAFFIQIRRRMNWPRSFPLKARFRVAGRSLGQFVNFFENTVRRGSGLLLLNLFRNHAESGRPAVAPVLNFHHGPVWPASPPSHGRRKRKSSLWFPE